jgi:hypothetical protein
VADRNDQTEEAREPHEHDAARRHGQSIAKRSDSHIASRTRRPRTLERARTLARARGVENHQYAPQGRQHGMRKPPPG